MATIGYPKLATPCFFRLTSCCCSPTLGVQLCCADIYNNWDFKPDHVCFKYFLGLRLYEVWKVLLSFNYTPVHSPEWMNLPTPHLSSSSSFSWTALPANTAFDISWVLQGLVEMSLPPCPLCISKALHSQCSCRTHHTKPCGVVIWAHLILSFPCFWCPILGLSR